jgi:cellulose biosynthesis protein BcsQ
VGKTSIAINLAAYLARFLPGSRGLILDLDGQCNTTEFLSGPEAMSTYEPAYESRRDYPPEWKPRPPGILDVLRQTMELGEVLRDYTLPAFVPGTPPERAREAWAGAARVSQPKCKYALSHRCLDEWNKDTGAVRSTHKDNVLADELQSYRRDFDWVVIDTPPGNNYLLTNAITAATDVVIVTRPGLGAIYGIYETNVILKRCLARRATNTTLQWIKSAPAMVLLNQWSAGATAARQLAEVRELYSHVMPVVGPVDARMSLQNSALNGVDVFAWPQAGRDGEIPTTHMLHHAFKPIADRVSAG